MMDVEIRETIEAGLDRLRGDNLSRARRAFSKYTPAEMQEQYGESGQTRQQILDEYEAHDDKVKCALEWLAKQP